MILKKINVLLIFILLLTSCEKFNKPQKPKNLIARSEMINILYDLYVVNSAKGVNVKVLEENGINPESYILTKYNIDSLQFAQSNTYYAYDTETYSELIEDVKSKIEAQKSIYEAELKKDEEREKRKRDSLRAARKKAIENPVKTMTNE